MEINGLSKIYIKLMKIHQEGRIQDQDFKDLESLVFLFKAYLIETHSNPSLLWSDFLKRNNQS